MLDLLFVKFLFRVYCAANLHRAMTVQQLFKVVNKSSKNIHRKRVCICLFPSGGLLKSGTSTKRCGICVVYMIQVHDTIPPSPVRTKTLAWWWRWCQRQLWQVGFSNGCSWRPLTTPNPFLEPKITPAVMEIPINFENLQSLIKVLGA